MNEAVWKAAEEKIGMGKNQSYGDFWLGMNDLKDGTYRYVSNGNEVVDGMWRKGEPNNNSHTSASEHCVSYWSPSFPRWYDVDCSRRKMSICVLPVDSAEEEKTGSRDTGENF